MTPNFRRLFLVGSFSLLLMSCGVPSNDQQLHSVGSTPDYLFGKSDIGLLRIQHMMTAISLSSTDAYPKLTLSVRCDIKQDSKPFYFNSQAKISKIIYDNGWRPASHQNLAVQEQERRRDIGPDASSFHFQITIPAPTRDAKTIKRLEGTFAVGYDAPNKSDRILTPSPEPKFEDAGAFQLKLWNMDDDYRGRREYIVAEITAIKIGNTKLRLGDYYDFTLLLKNGRRIRSSGASYETRDQELTCKPRFSMSEPIDQIRGVVVEWNSDGKMVDIPFIFENIPLL